MKLVVDAFKNVTQKEAVVFPAHWNCIISPAHYNGGGLGAVDAMMKKDVKAIVASYKRIVAKRGAPEFSVGEYKIVIEEWCFGPALQTITCRVVED